MRYKIKFNKSRFLINIDNSSNPSHLTFPEFSEIIKYGFDIPSDSKIVPPKLSSIFKTKINTRFSDSIISTSPH